VNFLKDERSGRKVRREIVMDLCIKDPKSGKVKCVKGGYKMIIELQYPELEGEK